MSTDEEAQTGIPTRAIHEAYLEMQRALKQHRQATDSGDQQAIERAHGDVQEAVLTFYELLRPHLKQNNGVEDYWTGRPPSYNGLAEPPDPDDGKGILQVQRRNQSVKLNGTQPDELESLQEWHEELDMGEDVRLLGVQSNGKNALVHYYAFQLGLRQLDDWRSRFVEQQTDLGGFMSGKTETEKRRQRVPMPKLRRASRELSEVAEKLGALSRFDASTPRTEITDELIEEVEEWRQANLE